MKLFSKLKAWLGLDREVTFYKTSLAEIERKAALRKALLAEWRDQFHLWQRARNNKKKHSHFAARMEAIDAELAALYASEI